MKVMHVASEYPPHQVYGLGRFVHHLSEAQAALGCEVHVLTNSAGGAPAEAEEKGVHVHRIHTPGPPEPPDPTMTVTQFNAWLLQRGVEAVESRGAPDVVNAHDWLTTLTGSALAKLYGIPLVVTVHDTVPGKHFGQLTPQRSFQSSLEAWACDNAMGVLCCSAHVREELVSYYSAKRDRVYVVPAAVRVEDFGADDHVTRVIRSVIAEPDQEVVLYVGRLDKEKGVDVLLQACSLLAGLHSRLKLVLVGDGSLKQELRQLTLQLGLDGRTLFTGYLCQRVLACLYRAADAVVCPSLYEPFGIVALEALACGRPLIVSRSGGLAEIVTDGVDGLYCEPGSAEDLARHLYDVLSDKERAEDLGRHGAQTVRTEYTWPLAAKRTLAVYEEVRRRPQ